MAVKEVIKLGQYSPSQKAPIKREQCQTRLSIAEREGVRPTGQRVGHLGARHRPLHLRRRSRPRHRRAQNPHPPRPNHQILTDYAEESNHRRQNILVAGRRGRQPRRPRPPATPPATATAPKSSSATAPKSRSDGGGVTEAVPYVQKGFYIFVARNTDDDVRDTIPKSRTFAPTESHKPTGGKSYLSTAGRKRPPERAYDIRPANWYDIRPANWYDIRPANWYDIRPARPIDIRPARATETENIFFINPLRPPPVGIAGANL